MFLGEYTDSADKFACCKMPAQHKQRQIDLDFTLKRVFKKTSFRPLQREVIQATLEGHDVFLQAATSFGKSLCFQLPAIVDTGITIVVSPLLALMNNQVTALRDAGVEVATLNSQTPMTTKLDILADLQSGHPYTRLLYVTPEYCQAENFRKLLCTVHKQNELSRVAVDEAHCISEWGHDFRPSFLQLSWFKAKFPDVPLIAVTATATARVRNNIIKALALDARTLKVFGMTTSRPNLHYEIRFKSDEEDHYTSFLHWIRSIHARRSKNTIRAAELAVDNARPGCFPGIVYSFSRLHCEALALRLSHDGIGAKPFHAKLSAGEKADHLAGWVANRPGYDVIVATTAFGMGIDKADVRFVAHWQLPKSFEGYYQEAGRAGRDGKASLCVLYYSREDRDRAVTLMQGDMIDISRKNNSSTHGQGLEDPHVQGRFKSMQSLVDYCESVKKCRHQLICRYFDEEGDAADCDFACDYCKDSKGLEQRKEDGLASEEWCSTQRESGAYNGYDEYD